MSREIEVTTHWTSCTVLEVPDGPDGDELFARALDNDLGAIITLGDVRLLDSSIDGLAGARAVSGSTSANERRRANFSGASPLVRYNGAMTTIKLLPYEDPGTLERLRGATAMTFAYDYPGWTMVIADFDGTLGSERRFPNLSALGVLRMREWVQCTYGADTPIRVEPST